MEGKILDKIQIWRRFCEKKTTFKTIGNGSKLFLVF